MKNAAVLKLFKKLVAEENLANPQIYLFGSRARRDHTPDSDWDFLVVSERKLSQTDALSVKRNVRLKFHDKYLDPLDILVRDRATFEQEQKIPNTLAYEAAREGILL